MFSEKSLCDSTLGCRAVLTISREAIRHNVKEICKFTGKKIIAVVKSDAYGVGAEQVVPLLSEMDEVEAFAVACAEEGAELREMGVDKDILILGGVFPEELALLKEYNLTPIVSDKAHLKVLKGESIPFHIKYDTGMGRLGFLEETITDPRIVGVMSHFSTPADREFSLSQVEKFKKIASLYPKGLWVHLESSAGLIYKVPFTTHVRVGLALYGEKPLKNYPLSLKPALSLKARVISVKEVPAGHPISYGRTFVAPRKMKIAVISLGYADGLMKSLSNKGYLLYKRKRLPILGNVTMDMTVVDVSGADVSVGDWVEVVSESRTFVDLAKDAGTIPYELMCNLSKRVKRRVV